jgi:hypothetical protein
VEQQDPGNALQITNDVILHFSSIRKWALLLSIMGFAGSGFLLLFGLFFGFISRLLPLNQEMSQFSFMPIMMLYVFLAIVYFLPSLWLFNFSRNLKVALQAGRQAPFVEAFKYLKFHFIFVGVMALLAVCFVVLGLVLAIGLGILAGVISAS